jgi:NAD(P)-dependent dehydrogenase (short-subunit alcohol dehydrogenase family)
MTKIHKLINMKGKKALITGASGYLGREIVSTLYDLGVTLYLTDISIEALSVFNNKRYSKVIKIPCNLSIENERKLLIKKIRSLDILINNAAYVGTTKLKGWNTKFANQSIKTWQEAMEVNLTAPFHLIRDFYPILKKNNNSSVINISSIYGSIAPDYSIYKNTNIHNIAAYATSKAGINQLTKWSASTLGPKVRVNTISIGGIYRKQNKNFVKKYKSKTFLNRMTTESDVMGGVIFFASDMSKYVTGQNLFIDGGFTV